MKYIIAIFWTYWILEYVIYLAGLQVGGTPFVHRLDVSHCAIAICLIYLSFSKVKA